MDLAEAHDHYPGTIYAAKPCEWTRRGELRKFMVWESFTSEHAEVYYPPRRLNFAEFLHIYDIRIIEEAAA